MSADQPQLFSEDRGNDTDALARLGLAIGMEIRVDGETAVFRIRQLAPDGSVWCVSDREWRAFRPEWCYPATVVNRRGRRVPGRLPPERRGLRDQWRRDHIAHRRVPTGRRADTLIDPEETQ